jgi:hypothetical protein
MAGDDARDARSGAPPERTAKGDSLRDKVGAAVFGFLLTGVVGTMVATWFQQRSWAWQSKVTQVEKDTQSALDSLQSTTDLLDKRWSATFQMVQAIGNNNKEGDEAKAIKGTFRSVNNEWELRYANIDALVEFNVDRPFGVDAKRIPDALWLLPCNAFPFDGEGAAAIDSNSAHIILTLINYCQRLVTDNLGKTPNDQTARKRLLDDSYFVLSNIYYINDALRCVMLGRAVAMRHSLDAELSLGSFFQIGPQRYKIPVKERDCLTRYKEWSAKHPPKQE